MITFSLHRGFVALLLCALVALPGVAAADAKTPLRPKALALLTAQASQAFRNGEFLRAAELARQLTVADPADPLHWQLLGQSLAGASDLRGARQAYQKALEVRPDGPIALATRALLEKLPAPDPRAVKVDDAFTLADWLPLAEEMARQGKTMAVLQRNRDILAAQGDIPQLEAMQDRLVKSLLAPFVLTDADSARKALEGLRSIKPLTPNNLGLLRQEGMACHLLANFDCATVAYGRWMQLAGAADNERGLLSRLLLQARQGAALNASIDVPPLGAAVLPAAAGDGPADGGPGLWVQSMAAEGLALRLGLQRGDLILRVGQGGPVTAAELSAWAEKVVAAGDTEAARSPVTVWRGERRLSLRVTPSRQELATLSDQAFRQYFAGDCATAAGPLKDLASYQPDDPVPWMLLGQCRLDEKNLAAAREAYQHALQLGKDSHLGKEARDRLAALPQPDPYTIRLESGLTLGDWITLQKEALPAAKTEASLGEVREYILRYGPLPALAEMEKRLAWAAQEGPRKALQASLRTLRVSDAAEARAALPRIAQLKAQWPGQLALLRLEGRACHLMEAYSCALTAYSQWLLAVPGSDPGRRGVVDALLLAQRGQPLPPLARATGEILRHCRDCPEVVVIAAGTLEQGAAGQGMIRLEKPIALGRTEVTQRQWQDLMGNNPSEFKHCGPECPVDNVSWNDAQEYVRRLASHTGKPYRLPSEAEWEAACRAGSDDEYCGGGEAREIAWYGAYGGGGGNSAKTTHPVATRKPNAWGLFDMSGNVSEWVADGWQAAPLPLPAGHGTQVDEAPRKVVKGGSWASRTGALRPDHRDWDRAGERYFFTGFRVAVTLEP